jgi:carbon monoxide dehydrogenase subunit G
VIETQQTILVAAAIGNAWRYVQDIQNWASLMPGCRGCTVIDANDSRWILKVGAGGLVRTVNVLVHIDQWDRPERVVFSFKLDGDPVEGDGSYSAIHQTDNATEITLGIRVRGSGAMAPMWEAVSKPLLPVLAKSFAAKLKAQIERTAVAPAP